MALIEVDKLRKTFTLRKREPGAAGFVRSLFSPKSEVRVAVDQISLRIEEGEILGLIGPNGAGKSTTIKCLAGILVPTSGCVTVNSLIPYRERTRHARQIGVVFGQKTALWWDVPVIDTFRLLKDIYEVSDEDYRRNLALFDDVLGLSEFQATPVRQLSLGQRMRADLAAALLHNPRVLFLDEPTIGLDISVKERLREFIREINRRRRLTVLLTTHDMHDVERLCERLLIIDHGRLVYQGSIEETIHYFAPESTMIVEFSQVPDRPVVLPDCQISQMAGLKYTVRFCRDRLSAADVIGQLMQLHPVRDLTLKEPDIEEIVRGIYDRRYPTGHGMEA